MLDFYWIADNWFSIIQTLGVVGGLLFTGLSLRQGILTERVKFQFDLSENHANIWREIFDNPNLARLLDPNADMEIFPITRQEEVFVKLLIHHLGCAHEAWSHGLIEKPSGVDDDIRRFFNLPIPKFAWNRLRQFQSSKLVHFIEKTICEPN